MIEYRPARYTDYISIAALHAENWERTYRGMMSDHYLDNEVRQDRLDVWKKRFDEPVHSQKTIVAVQNEALVGFVCVMLNDDPEFGSLVDNLHVSEQLRKSGIGKQLLKECAQLIIANANNHRMYLWVYEKNLNARAAYEKLGATHHETIEKANDDGSIAKICRCTWPDVSTLL